MKDMLSKEHYCCKINKLLINEKQCFPSSFMVFQSSQLSTALKRWGAGWGLERGGSHCKWCANDIAAYSKNNVIFFYKQTIPISPFVQPAFDIPLFLNCFASVSLYPILGKSFPFP